MKKWRSTQQHKKKCRLDCIHQNALPIRESITKDLAWLWNYETNKRTTQKLNKYKSIFDEKNIVKWRKLNINVI